MYNHFFNQIISPNNIIYINFYDISQIYNIIIHLGDEIHKKIENFIE